MLPAIEARIGKARDLRLPPELEEKFKHAYRLEWLTVGYLLTVTIIMYLATGSSQAMKAAWIEDVVSIFPAVAFLLAAHVHKKSANKNYPYGYYKAFTVAFVAASVALLVLGLFILISSISSLIKQEHSTIGSVNLLGHEIWLGWLMLLALLYSFVPAVVLGKRKMPLASALHEKILYVDAEAQKADWMTAAAGMIGVIGIGFGIWWADPVAAIFISLSVVKDGFARTRDSMKDLLEEMPTTFDNKQIHPLVSQVIELCLDEDWVDDVRVRMREHGMVFFGDLLLIPKTEDRLVERIGELELRIRALDWKIGDVVISPVRRFPEIESAPASQ